MYEYSQGSSLRNRLTEIRLAVLGLIFHAEIRVGAPAAAARGRATGIRFDLAVIFAGEIQANIQ